MFQQCTSISQLIIIHLQLNSFTTVARITNVENELRRTIAACNILNVRYLKKLRVLKSLPANFP